MKTVSERCLSLLGFSPLTSLPPHHTLGTSVQVVGPAPGDEVGRREREGGGEGRGREGREGEEGGGA